MGYKKRLNKYLILCILVALVLTLPMSGFTSAVVGGTTSTASEAAINVSVDNQTGQIAISGSIPEGKGKQVGLVIRGPRGRIAYLGQNICGDSGSYSFAFRMKSGIAGVYTAVVSASGMTVPQTITFAYTAPPTPTPTPVPDILPPVIADPAQLTLVQTDPLYLEIKAEDAESGVKAINIALDGKTVDNPIVQPPVSLQVGDHTISVEAVDNAGNIGNRTFILIVTMDVEHLDELLTYGFGQGWIKDKGTLNSLMTKVKNIQKSMNDVKAVNNGLKALQNEVKDQAGNMVNSDFAALILKDIDYLLKK
jgi:hypothetical protein